MPEGDVLRLTASRLHQALASTTLSRVDLRWPGVDDATAQRLVEAAHQVCPNSKATRGNNPVTVSGTGA